MVTVAGAQGAGVVTIPLVSPTVVQVDLPTAPRVTVSPPTSRGGVPFTPESGRVLTRAARPSVQRKRAPKAARSGPQAPEHQQHQGEAEGNAWCKSAPSV